MGKSRHSDDLLELIRTNASLAYLSDTHSVFYRGRVMSAIAEIGDAQYDAETWREAASYILGEELSPAAAADIKRELLFKLG